jgi:hypothetical protein
MIAAGAATKTPVAFCKDVAGITSIPSPVIPTSDSTSAIAAGLAQLPAIETSLGKISAKASAAGAMKTPFAAAYKVIASQVQKESADLSSLKTQATQLITLLDESSANSSSAIVKLAGYYASALVASTTAATYLTINRPAVIKTCGAGA